MSAIVILSMVKRMRCLLPLVCWMIRAYLGRVTARRAALWRPDVWRDATLAAGANRWATQIQRLQRCGRYPQSLGRLRQRELGEPACTPQPQRRGEPRALAQPRLNRLTRLLAPLATEKR